ncbi:MAG: carbohydrate ABC transporter permease [Alphaproteobacteria bacterium]
MPAAGTTVPARRPFWRREPSVGWLAFLMNTPSMIVLFGVLAYPIYYAGFLSLHQVGLAQMRRGVFPFYGLQNYANLFEDPLFWLALKNTVIFTIFVVSVEIVAAIAIGLLLMQASVWTSRVTRFLMLLPYAVPPIANGLIWSFIYNFKFGFLNRVLLTSGITSEPINWAGNADTALIAVAIPYIWRTLPFAVLLVYAALQGINRELYEAAAVDGASAWRRFWHITLPMLRPIIVVVLILRTSFAFAVFEEVLAITQGGPGDATWVSAWYGYKVSFAPPFNIGMGAASAYVLALIVGLFAIAYVKLFYRRMT